MMQASTQPDCSGLEPKGAEEVMITPVVIEVATEDHHPRQDIYTRVSKALKKLEFSAPGPQMKSTEKKSRLRKSRQDPPCCDCLEEDCPGCFLPCPKCKLNKCGVLCRVNRNWSYLNTAQTESLDSCKTADT